MNDFTKEELIELRACLDVCFAENGSDDVLMYKLDYLIDNYCTHKNLTIENAIIDKCKDCNWSGFKHD